MRTKIEETTKYNPITYEDDFSGYILYLKCKDVDEFATAFNRIKNVNGIEMGGCPYNEEDGYSDIIAVVKRKNWSKREMYEEINEIRKEVKKVICE